jgi:uroporphyrinogen decarboxylase
MGNFQEPNLLLRAARGEKTERPPVWMMRQAGRTDPLYLETRERSGLPLEDLFRHQDYAVEISLLPKRIGVDAIIFFQDILTPLAPMGAPFIFRPGPILNAPIRKAEQVDNLVVDFDPAEELPFVGGTLSDLRQSLGEEHALLGFAGSPLTLLFFMVEGASPGKATHAFRLLQEDPALAHALLEKLAGMTIRYLNYQIESGAQAVQLFESIADLLTPKIYREFALPYHQKIFEGLEGGAPTILFAKGFEEVELMRESGPDVLSVSSDLSLSQIRDRLEAQVPLQGNVSNRLLVEGTPEEIEEAVKDCIQSGGCKGHILNLDHGLLRETPWENVQHFVKCAKELPASLSS